MKILSTGLTWESWVWEIFVIGAVPIVFFRIGRAEHIQHRTRCYGCELMNIASCCRIQHRGVAWCRVHAIGFQPCQSHCNNEGKYNPIMMITSKMNERIRFPDLKQIEISHLEGTIESLGSTQSYDFICIFPSKSLLKTVISGWLWRGITAVSGRKKMHNCTQETTNSITK